MKAVFWVVLVVLAIVMGAGVSSYNSLNAKDERIRSGWAQVLNQYQRRADLVPNLVESVKGIAEHEKEVFESVTEARARVGEVNISAENLGSAELLQQFQSAQGSLGGALSKLIAVSENYPDIKANKSFEDLQAQLEGTENRIAVERKRYIEAVRDYNITVRSFPTNTVASFFSFNQKPNFTVADEDAVSEPPKVNLSN